MFMGLLLLHVFLRGGVDWWGGPPLCGIRHVCICSSLLPIAECSDSQLKSSVMPHFSKSSTSAVRLILGFQGVLGVVAVGMVCTPPNGTDVHSRSSEGGKGMSILKRGAHQW